MMVTKKREDDVAGATEDEEDDEDDPCYIGAITVEEAVQLVIRNIAEEEKLRLLSDLQEKRLKKEKEAEEAANAQTAPGGAPLPPKAETTGAMLSGHLDQR